MRKAYIFAAGLALLSTPASSEWLKVKEEPGVTSFIEVGINRVESGSGDRVVAKVLLNFDEAVGDERGNGYKSMLSRLSVDCSHKTALPIDTTFFAEPMAEGKRETLPNVVEGAVGKPIAPDGPLGRSLQFICK